MPSRTRALLPAKSTTQGFGEMRIELGFPVEYDVQLLSELPAKRGVDHEWVYRFPQAKNSGPSAGDIQANPVDKTPGAESNFHITIYP